MRRALEAAAALVVLLLIAAPFLVAGYVERKPPALVAAERRAAALRDSLAQVHAELAAAYIALADAALREEALYATVRRLRREWNER